MYNLRIQFQMRIWKRSLYVWGGEEPSSSCSTSICSDSEHNVSETEGRQSFQADIKVKPLLHGFSKNMHGDKEGERIRSIFSLVTQT